MSPAKYPFRVREPCQGMYCPRYPGLSLSGRVLDCARVSTDGRSCRRRPERHRAPFGHSPSEDVRRPARAGPCGTDRPSACGRCTAPLCAARGAPCSTPTRSPCSSSPPCCSPPRRAPASSTSPPAPSRAGAPRGSPPASATAWVAWCTSPPAPWASPRCVLASAELFTALKLVGAAYLVWIGARTVRRRAGRRRPSRRGQARAPVGPRRAFREGIMVEALNPKTAAFFLAFLPQFVDRRGRRCRRCSSPYWVSSR